MSLLEDALQQLHEAKERIQISWLWDGGIDVKVAREEINFKRVAELLPSLHHWCRLRSDRASRDVLVSELQKIYDSEINITIIIADNTIRVAIGDDFTGFDAEGDLQRAVEILPWLQNAIHEKYPTSKYSVERQGGSFTQSGATSL